MTIEDIALKLRDDATAVQLLYAFNSVGKTRLSVAPTVNCETQRSKFLDGCVSGFC